MSQNDHGIGWEGELGLSSMVMRLRNDPARIALLVRALPVKRTIFRCSRSLYSTSAALSRFIYSDGSLRAAGDLHGFEVETDAWEEVFLYEAASPAGLELILEISDAKGRGTIKFILDRQQKDLCLARSESLISETLDGWANLHIKKTDTSFTDSNRTQAQESDIKGLLNDIREEADDENVMLSMVLMGETQSVWDTFVPWALPDSKWFTFGTSDRCFSIDPASYRSFYATIRGDRRVSTFFTKGTISRFSLVEPEGVRLACISEAVRRLE